MSKSDDHFERFEDHTLLKHAVLTSYLKAWGAKLLQGQSAAVHFVDGFAGAGCDGDGKPGSPMIALRVALELRGMAGVGKLLPDRRMCVTAFENHAATFKQLQLTSGSLVGKLGDQALVVRGKLTDHLSSVRARVPNAPTLTFLDPFGLKGLDARTYSALLSGPRDELFVLFSHLGAMRLYGVMTKDPSQYYLRLREIQNQPLLFPDEQAAAETEARNNALRSETSLLQTAVAAEDIFSVALGDAWPVIKAQLAKQSDGASFLVEQFAMLLLGAGAQLVLMVPMCDENGAPKYMLMHASKSTHALQTMKESFTTALNNDELSETMRERIRSDLTVPLDALLEFISERFAGRTVFWSTNPRTRRSEGTMRDVLLNETPVFHFQMQQVKDRLKELGWFTRIERREAVRIPRQNA